MRLFIRVCRITHVKILVLLLVPFVGASAVQSPTSISRPEILVEVTAIHTSPETENSYLYLRVFSNGLAEWQSSRFIAGKKGPSTNSQIMKTDDFLRIKSVLDDPRLQKLKQGYDTRFAAIDSWTTWKVAIPRKNVPQTIQITEFSPDLANAMKSPYPDALVNLGCALKTLRSQVSGAPSPPFKMCLSPGGH